MIELTLERYFSLNLFPFQSFQYPLPWSECPVEIEPVTNISIVNEECEVSATQKCFCNQEGIIHSFIDLCIIENPV